MTPNQVRLAEDSSLPLAGGVSAMMTSEINTAGFHYCTGNTEPTNQSTEMCSHAHPSMTDKMNKLCKAEANTPVCVCEVSDVNPFNI